jgi:GR25 family glycosyltransferase involved in LPS biosynthesis
MSHLALWKRLMHDASCDVYVVMEDDAELVDDFEVKLDKAIRLFASDPRAELCFISGFSITDPCTNASNLQLIKKNNRNIDGTGGYLIKKSGAGRFVDYYNTHSMKVSIDAAIVFDFNEHLCEMNQYLIKSPFFGPDTDIQQSYDCISFCDDAIADAIADVFIMPATTTSTTTATTPTKTLHQKTIIRVAFCDWWQDEYCGGVFNVHDNFFVNLLKNHVDTDVVITTVSPSQTPDILFYSVFVQSNGAYRARRKVFYAGEPVSHRTNADFNLTFDASNAINTRLPLWVCYFDHAILSPRQIPKREKFCSYIATNPRANRQTFVDQLSSQYKRVDCGGKHLNNIGGAIPPGTNASGKIEHNKQYKLAIAFENTQYPGYVTEKAPEAWATGAIPLYWGSDPAGYLNQDAMINLANFQNLESFMERVREVDGNPELWSNIAKQPILKRKPDLEEVLSVLREALAPLVQR